MMLCHKKRTLNCPFFTPWSKAYLSPFFPICPTPHPHHPCCTSCNRHELTLGPLLKCHCLRSQRVYSAPSPPVIHHCPDFLLKLNILSPPSVSMLYLHPDLAPPLHPDLSGVVRLNANPPEQLVEVFRPPVWFPVSSSSPPLLLRVRVWSFARFIETTPFISRWLSISSSNKSGSFSSEADMARRCLRSRWEMQSGACWEGNDWPTLAHE